MIAGRIQFERSSYHTERDLSRLHWNCSVMNKPMVVAQPTQEDCTLCGHFFWSYICRCFIPAKSRGVTLMKNRPPLSRVTHKRLASSLKLWYAHEDRSLTYLERKHAWSAFLLPRSRHKKTAQLCDHFFGSYICHFFIPAKSRGVKHMKNRPL